MSVPVVLGTVHFFMRKGRLVGFGGGGGGGHTLTKVLTTALKHCITIRQVQLFLAHLLLCHCL